MSIIQIDMTRYCELLRKEEEMARQGKILSHHNPTEYLEIMEYTVILAKKFTFENKESYLLLLKKFVEAEIDGETFHRFFWSLQQNYLQTLHKIDKEIEDKEKFSLELDSKANELFRLLQFIFGLGEVFTNVEAAEIHVQKMRKKLKTEFGRNLEEDEFRSWATEIWAEIQTLLQQE